MYAILVLVVLIIVLVYNQYKQTRRRRLASLYNESPTIANDYPIVLHEFTDLAGARFPLQRGQEVQMYSSSQTTTDKPPTVKQFYNSIKTLRNTNVTVRKYCKDSDTVHEETMALKYDVGDFRAHLQYTTQLLVGLELRATNNFTITVQVD